MAMPSTRTSSALYRRNRRITLSRSTVCHLCGGEGATTVDHLTPHSVASRLGWPPAWIDGLPNLAPAHATCNSSRGARPLTTYTAEAA